MSTPALGRIQNALDRCTALEVDAKTAQAQINVDFLSGVLVADGSPIVAFSDGVADGCQLIDSKSTGYRWNNGATPAAIAKTVELPQDLDDTKAITVKALVSKSGATLADATKLTIAAFFQVPGALHDADADAGGDSDAVVGDALAKTLTELSLVIAAADVPAAPAALTLTIKPKAGTLGTDDLFLHGLRIAYTRKQLTG